MKAIVLTPDREYYSGDIKSVTLPGTSGEFEILSDHAPIISSLTAGRVVIVDDSDKKIEFTVKNGFVEVLDNVVSLLVSGLEE